MDDRFPCAPQPEGGICTEDSVDASLAGDLVLASYNPLSSSEAILEARTRDDGSLLWSRTFTDTRKVTAVRHQGRGTTPTLVKVAGNGGPDRLIALDLSTGEDVWAYDLTSVWNQGFAFPSFEPTRVGDVVAFSECSGDGDSGEDECGVVALDADSGAERWRFASDQSDHSAVAESSVFTVAGAELVALDPMTAAADGEARWRASLDESPLFLPAADGEHVYAIVSGGTLVAFDAATGDIAWEAALPDSIQGRRQIVLGGDSIHVIGEGDLSGRCSS